MDWYAKVLECQDWLATVDDVKTRILLLNEDIFIPELI